MLNGKPAVSMVKVPSTLTLAPGPALIPPTVVIVATGGTTASPPGVDPSDILNDLTLLS